MAASRIPAVFFDVYMEAFSRIIVPEIHLVCRYLGRLNPELLRKALRLALDAEPVAGCRYVRRFIAPYWERLRPQELDTDQLVMEDKVSESRFEERLVREFLSRKLPETGPRAAAMLISAPGGDTLVLKVDHRIADAAAVKAFSYGVCNTYRKLSRDPGFVPAPNKGPRGVDQILSRIPRKSGPKMLALALEEARSTAKPFATLTFSGQGREEGRPSFALRTWDREWTARALEKARMHEATVNDLMLAAYLRALTQETGWKPGRALRIMGTVDVRRYLPGHALPGMANLSSMYCLNLEYILGDDFSQTLVRVKTLMDKAKENFLGLPLMVGGMMLIGLLPAGLKMPAVAGPLLVGGKKDNFPPGYTNLGVLEPDRLSFEGERPVQAFCVTPAARPPFFVLGFSGFSGTLTVSAGTFSSAMPAGRVESLVDRMGQELFH
ncbi:MAG: hypothetical protein AB1921_06960 [Thermodesulfobacteriota bacterium]